jgi:hypothetical protein
MRFTLSWEYPRLVSEFEVRSALSRSLKVPVTQLRSAPVLSPKTRLEASSITLLSCYLGPFAIILSLLKLFVDAENIRVITSDLSRTKLL